MRRTLLIYFGIFVAESWSFGLDSSSSLKRTVNDKDRLVISRKEGGGIVKTFQWNENEDNDNEGMRAHYKNAATGYKTTKLGKEAWRRMSSVLRTTFLPVGYPNKLPRGYLKYCLWSALQDLSTQLRGVLATQRVLEGVGVGREGATALSASLNFLVRDGAGMAASLLFTYLASADFKLDVKRWRIFADCIVDLGITLEVAATLVPSTLFLPMICVGNTCKSMCGVAAGACGGAINLYWAKGSHISDINAKFGAQNTVTGSVGLIFAAMFVRSISSASPYIIWSLYSLLTFLHIFANVRLMKLVAFDYLNLSRMNILVSKFFNQYSFENRKRKHLSSSSNDVVLDSPASVSNAEPLFFLFRNRSHPSFPIYLGLSFNDFVYRFGRPLPPISNLQSTLRSEGYIVATGTKRVGNPCILILLCNHSSRIQKAKAYFHALILERALKERGIQSKGLLHSLSSSSDIQERAQLAENDTVDCIDDAWEVFCNSAHASGWNLNKTELRCKGYEVEIQ